MEVITSMLLQTIKMSTITASVFLNCQILCHNITRLTKLFFVTRLTKGVLHPLPSFSQPKPNELCFGIKR